MRAINFARFKDSIGQGPLRMQETFVLSTAEAEFYAAQEMAFVNYLCNFLNDHDVGLQQDNDTPV